MSPVRIGDRPGHHRHPGGGLRRDAGAPIADAYRPVPVPAPPARAGSRRTPTAVVDLGAARRCAELVTERRRPQAITAAGLDNEGETVVAWDADTLRAAGAGDRVVVPAQRADRRAAAGDGRRASACASWPARRSTRTSRRPRSPGCSRTTPTCRPPPAPARPVRHARRLRARPPGRRRPHRPSTAARTQLQATRRAGHVGSRAVRDLRRRPGTAAADRPVDRRSRDARGPAAARDAGRPDSRAGRPRLRPAGRRPRRPTAPACFCSPTPARDPADPGRAAAHRGLDHRRRRPPTPSTAECSRPVRPSTGCATRWA